MLGAGMQNAKLNQINLELNYKKVIDKTFCQKNNANRAIQYDLDSYKIKT